MTCFGFRAFAAVFVLHSGLWNSNIVTFLSRMIVQTPWLLTERHEVLQRNYNRGTSQFLKQMLTFSFKCFALSPYLALALPGAAGWGGRTPGHPLPLLGDGLVPLNWSSVARWLKREPELALESVRYGSGGGRLMRKFSLSVAGKKSCVDEAMVCGVFFFLFFPPASLYCKLHFNEDTLQNKWPEILLWFTFIPWVLNASW